MRSTRCTNSVHIGRRTAVKPYLPKGAKTYRIHPRVPVEYQAAVGAKHVTRSLGTGDLRVTSCQRSRRWPAVECLSLLPIERILYVHSPRHRPLCDADVIEHEADRVRVDPKGRHSGGHSATQVMHAEMVKSKFRSGLGGTK